jgi:hypothetical protein
MGNERISQLCFLSGFGLLIVSFAWPALVGGERAYSDEDAKAYQAASQNLHEVQEQARDSKTADAAEIQAAKDSFAALEAKREEAIVKGQTVSWVLKYLAAGVLGLGCVFHWILRDGA